MWQNFVLLFTQIINRWTLFQSDAIDILFSLALATFIAFIISQLYKHTHRGFNYEHAFMTTLVLLSPIVTVVMMFIRGDLVLSLGLIGSLSIIRFRTPIKDTRDMVFLFWSIVIGLGCGTFNWAIVSISTIFIVSVVLGLFLLRYGRSQNTDFILVVSGDLIPSNADLGEVISTYASDVRIRSHEIQNSTWEIIYELKLVKLQNDTAENLVQELKLLGNVQKVSLLAPQLALPL